MLKKIMLAAVTLVMAGAPFAPLAHAGTNDWTSLTADNAWTSDGYRVERLMFGGNVEGPFKLGSDAFVTEPMESCIPEYCGKVQMYVLKYGSKLLVENVPESALDAHRFATNDNRFVYAAAIEDQPNHFSVVERNLADGSTTVLVKDVFLNGVESVDVAVDREWMWPDVIEHVYFIVRHNFNGNSSLDQVAIYVWDSAEEKAKILGVHWDLREEHLLDASSGKVLEMLQFPDGNKQLWFGDTHNVNYEGMTREAIPGTWTEPHGDIVGAHMLPSGSIEYFQYFARYTYNPYWDKEPVRHEETINWYRDIDASYQLVGNRLAWIDDKDTVYVSNYGSVTKLGTAARGSFRLENNRIFWATETGGKVYTFSTKTTSDVAFGVTDSYGNAVAGTDKDGNVWFQDLATGATRKLGFGTNVVITDATHVYWRGTDGKIYEGTILPSAGAVKAMKLASSPMVYLIQGDTRKMILTEAVYFTWFQSWNSVQTVSEATLNSYRDTGIAYPAAPVR